MNRDTVLAMPGSWSVSREKEREKEREYMYMYVHTNMIFGITFE